MKTTRKFLLYSLICIFLLISCAENTEIDLILFNGDVYTAEDQAEKFTAIAVKEGRIYAIGKDSDLLIQAHESVKKIDLEGKFIMPGFIEGHGHFEGVGQSRINLNFLTDKSWEESLEKIRIRSLDLEEGEWLVGRGWHQEKWDSLPARSFDGYPTNHGISEIVPNNPMILFHASGHGLIANQKALDLAGVSRETSDPMGGRILKEDYLPTGMLEERAMDLVDEIYEEHLGQRTAQELRAYWDRIVKEVEDECLSKGITSFQDAGTRNSDIQVMRQIARENELDLRVWMMLREPYSEMDEVDMSQYPVINEGHGFFSSRAIKSEIDGALGSFGAWLLKPYSDKEGFTGQNTTKISDVKAFADICVERDMQLCVHAIGDRANQVVLDLYAHYLGKSKVDRRWRIEHAQHLSTEDIPRFAEFNIIASMQGIHCTSDAPFVERRLGKERARLGAYAWRSLIDSGAKIANGTDAPVEDVDPIKSFYASVTRKRLNPDMTFFVEQAMTRDEALKSYTINNAYAAFEENEKGSLKKGKYADFVVLSNNLLTCTDDEILATEVIQTYVDGELKYSRE